MANIIRRCKTSPEQSRYLSLHRSGRCCGSPCGACREFMMQLSKDSGNIEILTDFEARKTIRLKELLPDWWETIVLPLKNCFLYKNNEHRSIILKEQIPKALF